MCAFESKIIYMGLPHFLLLHGVFDFMVQALTVLRVTTLVESHAICNLKFYMLVCIMPTEIQYFAESNLHRSCNHYQLSD